MFLHALGITLIVIPVINGLHLKNETVLIAFLVRNKAHTLPFFLTLLEDLAYPKDRISLWIRSDNNVDNSNDILKKWLVSVDGKYHSINVSINDDPNDFQQSTPVHWSGKRFDHIISLREAALAHGKRIWADYLFFIDCDVFLTNENTLSQLIAHKHIVSAPMLRSDGLYSNFWCGMTENYYYTRTDDYEPILYRKNVSCFHVPMINTCMLIDLRYDINDLTFDSKRLTAYNGPRDDIITFAVAAQKAEIPLMICNNHVYGFVTIPVDNNYRNDPFEFDRAQLTNIKLEILNSGRVDKLYVKELFANDVRLPEKDRLGFDVVFMINLKRRPERRERMLKCFDELGVDVDVVDAVDGKLLNDSILNDWGVKFLPEYTDPYHKRPMTFGEIGCFMSHYFIWKKVIANDYTSVMVLEDDIHFEPFFRSRIKRLMNDVEKLDEWDLVYLGRKRLVESDEAWITDTLVHVGYSYWTLGYILSKRGAQKLIDAKPLEKLVPVDEYLPILFDKHPTDEWKRHFFPRNLKAYSAAPLLVYPTHYTGQHGYISDTEDSKLIDKPDVSVKMKDEL